MAKLIIGSRGSKLALTQTHHMRDQLCSLHADLEVEVEIIAKDTDGLPIEKAKGRFLELWLSMDDKVLMKKETSFKIKEVRQIVSKV